MRVLVRGLGSVWAIAMLVVLGLPAGPAGADPTVTTYTIQVSAYPTPYGQAPTFSYTPYYSILPPGASLIGKAICSQVYVSGGYGPTESTYGPNYSGLPPGSYQFVPSSCAPDDAFPLSLDGVNFPYRLVLVAGGFTVTTASTAVGGVGLQGPLKDGTPTPTVLSAVVLNTSTENVELAGKRVNFSIQLSNGVWDRNVCSAVTTDNGAGDYVALCPLDTSDAHNMYASTGVWTATYAGDGGYGPSSYSGHLSGLTSSADAAKALDAIMKSGTGVTLQPIYVPPDCGNPYAGIQDGSIIEVSLGQLDCSQLEALQITTGVLLGIASVAGAGGQAVLDIAGQIAANAAYRALNVGVINFAKWVVVPNPLNPLFTI